MDYPIYFESCADAVWLATQLVFSAKVAAWVHVSGPTIGMCPRAIGAPAVAFDATTWPDHPDILSALGITALDGSDGSLVRFCAWASEQAEPDLTIVPVVANGDGDGEWPRNVARPGTERGEDDLAGEFASECDRLALGRSLAPGREDEEPER